MPRIVFERSGFEVDVAEGVSIVDVCDQHIAAGVPFACRHANCGVCRMEVVEGAEHCEERTAWEAELLEFLREKPSTRLGCQLRVHAGDGLVRLRVL